MGNLGIRNATLITERPSCLPTNGNLITLLVFIIGGKKKMMSEQFIVSSTSSTPA